MDDYTTCRECLVRAAGIGDFNPFRSAAGAITVDYFADDEAYDWWRTGDTGALRAVAVIDTNLVVAVRSRHAIGASIFHAACAKRRHAIYCAGTARRPSCGRTHRRAFGLGQIIGARAEVLSTAGSRGTARKRCARCVITLISSAAGRACR